jgi:hypothetical protein
MNCYIRVLSGLLLLAAVPTPSARAADMPPIQTAFVILMENYGWSAIKGSTNAPYINNVLLPQASYCEQYYNPSNFSCSLLSYLWLEAGTTFGITTYDTYCDDPPSVNHQSTTNHLTSLLYRAGIPWKTYQEWIPGTVVPLVNYAGYAVRHNPFVYFDDATGTNNPNDPYGIAHNRPFTELAADLSNHTTARYIFITPDICNDMHDTCSPLNNNIQQGDAWLAAQLPKIMASDAYSNNGAIFITWDDAGGAPVPLGMIVLSPLARGHGYASTNRFTHSSLLRTLQEIFHVSPWLGDAANATNLSDLFLPVTDSPPGPLRFRGISSLTGAAVALDLAGLDTNAPVIVQTSTNYVDWVPVTTNQPSGPAMTISLTNPTPAQPRSFRAKQSLP